VKDQESDSSIEENGLLIDTCLLMNVESLENKAFSMFKTFPLEIIHYNFDISAAPANRTICY